MLATFMAGERHSHLGSGGFGPLVHAEGVEPEI